MSWVKTAYIGQRVVCIKGFDDDQFREYFEIDPYVGQVLTIRDMLPGTDISDKAESMDSIYLRFNEIVNKPYQYKTGFYECAFLSDNFKPVDETDISIFKEIAANPHKKIKGPTGPVRKKVRIYDDA